MEPVLSGRARHRARTTALVAALSLVVAPLVVAPAAVAATDPPPESQVAVEPTVEPTAEPTTGPTTGPTAPAALTDVVAPDVAQLAVAGTLRVGEQVVVDPHPELWTPADVDLAFDYRWSVDGVEVGDGTGAALVVPAGAVGGVLSVAITGTAPVGAVDGVPSASVVVTADGTVAPGAIAGADPTVSGTVRVGSRVTVQPGEWPEGTTLAYRWTVERATGTATVATTSSYTPVVADRGGVLTVAVTGKRPGYETTRTTVPVTVAAGVLTAPTPTISGTVRVGSKVAAKPGAWTAGTTLTYQWYASGVAISKATGTTYTPTASVKGKTLRVRVTGTKSGYTTVTRASGWKTVAAGVLSAPRPKISGTVRVGAKVAVAKGTWKPAASTYRYQWRANGAKISGATKSSYTVPSRYAGKKLTVTVTGSRSGYATTSVTSSSSTVLRVYSRTSAPKISGSARVGSTLKVSSRGTWTPKPSSWRYQWKANGTEIKGATRSSLKLTGAQYGKRITVTVKGVRSGYYSSTRTSAATARVTVPAPVLTKNGTYKVGTQIKAGTYVAPGSPKGCRVQRLDGNKKMVWAGLTYGQTIVTIRSTDKYFATTGCGTWRKYAAYGKVRTSTPTDGIYKVGTGGGQLKPGLYYTTGPAYSDDVCYVAALKSFTMTHAAIDEAAEFTEPGYWKVLTGDVGFEAYGCSWRRVSS
ncbi:hypothetical protein [Isoptericola sp. NPDC057653]|uniref:hypothetical protein n=1 Tax=Isoptericola sp. NPDC057653 TaxID=3346195 RepID=UPI00369E610C